MAIWITVSREAVKPSTEINWRKMITLLSAGSLSALVITIYAFFKACSYSPVNGCVESNKRGLTHFFVEVIIRLDSFVEQDSLSYLISNYLGGLIWAVHCLRRMVCLFY